jgi:hypothetical protein
MRRILAFALLAAASLATAGPTWAQPFVMSDDQADRVTAGQTPNRPFSSLATADKGAASPYRGPSSATASVVGSWGHADLSALHGR